MDLTDNCEIGFLRVSRDLQEHNGLWKSDSVTHTGRVTHVCVWGGEGSRQTSAVDAFYENILDTESV